MVRSCSSLVDDLVAPAPPDRTGPSASARRATRPAGRPAAAGADGRRLRRAGHGAASARPGPSASRALSPAAPATLGPSTAIVERRPPPATARHAASRWARPPAAHGDRLEAVPADAGFRRLRRTIGPGSRGSGCSWPSRWVRFSMPQLTRSDAPSGATSSSRTATSALRPVRAQAQPRPPGKPRTSSGSGSGSVVKQRERSSSGHWSPAISSGLPLAHHTPAVSPHSCRPRIAISEIRGRRGAGVTRSPAQVARTPAAAPTRCPVAPQAQDVSLPTSAGGHDASPIQRPGRVDVKRGRGDVVLHPYPQLRPLHDARVDALQPHGPTSAPLPAGSPWPVRALPRRASCAPRDRSGPVAGRSGAPAAEAPRWCRRRPTRPPTMTGH